MGAISLPPVPYDATAARPGWADLPAELRAAVTARLGTPVVRATTAGGGFTRGFAAVLDLTGGARVFVKAACLTTQPHLADWYAREAAVTAALPPEVPAPRPRWSGTEAGYFVLCLDAVDGHVPALPWRDGELRAALSAWSVSAAALQRPTPELRALGLPPLAGILREELSQWSEVAAGRTPMPPAPDRTADRLGDLVALERALPDLVAGDAMLHGDLRVDNVLIDRSGSARICDWAWPCLGAPWFDTVTLLISAYASGLDADALLEPWNAPADGVDGALAALGGYWLTRAAGPPSSASPHTRQHQRFSGEQALAWLASRRSRFGGG